MSIAPVGHKRFDQPYGPEAQDPRAFAQLMGYAQTFFSPQKQASPTPNSSLLRDAGTSALPFSPTNFSSNAIPVQPDQQPGNPHVLGSITQRPESYHSNESLKTAQFNGHSAKLNAPVNDWINARYGASNDPRVPVATDNGSDLAADAISSPHTAQLKATRHDDAGAYHYGQSPAVPLDHGLYSQIINLAGSKQAFPIS